MFIHSAPFYDALYSFKDYAEAVRHLTAILDREAPAARTLLDVGCGTGRHLQTLRQRYDVQGLDVDPAMLAVARERCPDVKFHEVDMARFSLPDRFDVITCLFSSIGYVKSRDRLRSAIGCMSAHLNPGGMLLVEPWFTPDDYWVGVITANHVDQPDLKIAWMYVGERERDIAVLDIHYLGGRPEGVETFRE